MQISVIFIMFFGVYEMDIIKTIIYIYIYLILSIKHLFSDAFNSQKIHSYYRLDIEIH